MTRSVLVTAAALMGMTMPALAASRTYDLPPFDSVSVAQGIVAIVDVGAAQSVSAEAPSEATLDRLDIRVEDNRLRIGLDGNFLNWLMDIGRWHEITVHVGAPAIVAAAASSGANLDVNNASGKAITIDASSGAAVAAGLAMDGGAVLTASSGGNVKGTGTCGHLVVNVSSGGNIEAGRLACGDVTANASSGGHVRLDAGNSLVANASSGGSIAVVRRPASTSLNSSSGGSVSFDQ